MYLIFCEKSIDMSREEYNLTDREALDKLYKSTTFAKILRANGFEPYSVICKVEGRAKSSMGIPEKCEEIGSSSQSGSCALYLFTFSSL
jgi:hypothetical protein